MEISYPPGPNSWGFFTDLAIDGSGNAWVVGGFGSSGDGIGEILASTLAWSSSTPMVGGGLAAGQPTRLTIDPSNNVWSWIQTGSGYPLVELNSSGTVLSGSDGYSTTGLSAAYLDLNSIAPDGSGNIWITTDNGGNIFEYAPGTGYANLNGFGGAGNNCGGPSGLAIDTSGDIWTPSVNTGVLCEYSAGGMVLSGSKGFSGGGVANAVDIAIDASGDVWVPNQSTDAIAEYSSSGAAVSPSTGYPGGSPGGNQGIAIDGAGNVWLSGGGADGNPSVITELSPSGAVLSGPNGYGTSTDLGGPRYIAVDGSGNLWVENSGSYINMVEFIGLATPVVTPIPANLKSPYGAHAVNKP
jgi:hypothetical protein